MADCAKPGYRAPIPPSPGRAVSPLSRICWLYNCGSYSTRGRLDRVGELKSGMRDAGGDARPTSLLVRGLVKVELRYDLRASEGEADSLLTLWLTAPPARSGGASEEYPFSRLSTTLTASVL